MKKYASQIINAVYSCVITISVLFCFQTAFDINVNMIPVLIAAPLFTAAAYFVSTAVKKRLEFVFAVAASAFLLVLFSVFTFDTLMSQLTYVINRVLGFYSRAFGFTGSVLFSLKSTFDATLLFAALSYIFSFISAVSLVKFKRIFPTVILSLLLLVPCYIVVDTPPDSLPLAITVACLTALYITAFIRANNYRSSGAALLAVTAVTLVLTLTVFNIFPEQGYSRFDWQEDLLGQAEELTGIKSSYGLGMTSVGDVQDNEISLNNAGKLKQTGVKELQVKSEKGGALYLKSIAYANYSDNRWTVLTEKQAEGYPEYYSAFTRSVVSEDETNKVSVRTERRRDTICLPYYQTDVGDGMSAVADIMVHNDIRLKSYEFTCVQPDTVMDHPGDFSGGYQDFVFDNYLSLPTNIGVLARKIIDSEGILSGLADEGYSDSDAADLIKQYVRSIGYYSLDTDRVPAGRDFAMWFLTEAESGYCVHYATATAVLLRAIGIPARYVTGFYVNAKENEWTTVTSDNAHAWVEYYDRSYGWVMLDSTPVSFTPAEYKEPEAATTPAQAQSGTQPTTQNSGYPYHRISEDKPSPWSGVLATVLAAIALAVIALFLRSEITLRARKRRFSSGSSNRRAVLIYRYIIRVHRCLKSDVPKRITDLAEKARFSRHSIDDDELKELQDYAEKARAKLSKSSAVLKRLYYRLILAL